MVALRAEVGATCRVRGPMGHPLTPAILLKSFLMEIITMVDNYPWHSRN
jgi:hypothetical protein